MTVDYDPGDGMISVAMHMKSTVVIAIILKAEFWILLFFHLGVSIAYRAGYFDPHIWGIPLHMRITHVTGALLAFFLVFYNTSVYNRYCKLYELTKTMMEYCLYAVSITSREITDRTLVRKMARQLLASSFLFFFERTAHEDSHEEGNISADEWEQLRALELLTEYETELLQDHCRRNGHNACASFLLIHWSQKLYRNHRKRINELEKVYWNIRRCQDDVVEIMELPMPFQYFHITNLMLALNLTLWAYSLALVETYFASIMWLLVQVVFSGMRELSVALADPYGDDEADFPVNEWMTTLYQRLYSVVEDPWDIKQETPIRDKGPLDLLDDDAGVINLLVGARKRNLGAIRKQRRRASQRDASDSEDDEDNLYKMHVKVNPMWQSGYRPLEGADGDDDALEEDEEMEEEEESDDSGGS